MSHPRVWFDILTPKQVLFFAPVIAELKRRGSDVLATSRRYREVGPLAEMCGLKLEFVGDRGGVELGDQLISAARRELDIIPIVRSFGPEVAVSVASSVCARVAFGLRIEHLAVNDSPHSEVAGRLSLPLSTRLLCPWIIPFAAWAKFGLSRAKITRYRALDPAVWLKRPPSQGPIPDLPQGKKTVTFRLEEGYAPYMRGTDKSLTGTLLAGLADSFPDLNLVAICRYGDQLEDVKHRFGDRYIIPSDAVNGRLLLERTDLFIGMGGTMTAEAALMGVPTISAFQGRLFTEAYLKSVGLVVKPSSPGSLIRLAEGMLKDKVKAAHLTRAKQVLSSMEDPVPKIVYAIEMTAKRDSS